MPPWGFHAQTDRREPRLDHPKLTANTFQPEGYKNEYKHPAILGYLEAGRADSPLCETGSTVTRRTSSSRGRSW
jgi:hypothetical protein